MEVILLERVEKLGQMGDVVKVKDGYARNYLLPQNKALRSTATNRTRFDRQRVDLEARNIERRGEAADLATRLDGAACVLVRQASDSGQLYGSVSARDIADGLAEQGIHVERRQVVLDRPIKTLGIHDVRVVLHPEVSVTVQANVARSAAEAEAQARGEAVGLEAELAQEAAEQAALEAAAATEAEEQAEDEALH